MRKLLTPLLMIAAAVYSGVYFVHARRLGPSFRGNEEIAAYDGSRLAAVRPLLKPWERVGFLEDAYVPGERLWKYYVAQYVLAPAILINDDPKQPMVLVNFRDLTRRMQAPAGLHYKLLRHCGPGVWLYRVTIDR